MKKYLLIIANLTFLSLVSLCQAQLNTYLYQSSSTNRAKCTDFKEFISACPPLIRYYSDRTLSDHQELQETNSAFYGEYTYDVTCVANPPNCYENILTASGDCEFSDVGYTASGSVDGTNGWSVVDEATDSTNTYTFDLSCDYSPFDGEGNDLNPFTLGLLYDGGDVSGWGSGSNSATMTATEYDFGTTLSPGNYEDYYGTSETSITLSSEITTESLLGSFGSFSAIQPGTGGGSGTITADQSQVSMNGSRNWFLINCPKGNFKVPYVIHFNIPGLADIYSTNFFRCAGNGASQYYPSGGGLVLNAPFAKAETSCSTFYVGGTASVSLLGYMCMDDGSDKGLDCPCSCQPLVLGMPRWWVTEPYINLWIGDNPVEYTTSLGKKVTFSVDYKENDTRPTSINGQTTFMPINGWNNNWCSYVHFVGQTDTNADGSFNGYDFTNWTATVYEPQGGETSYTANQGSDPKSGNQLLPLDGVNPHVYPFSPFVNSGGPLAYGGSGFRVVHPDGSQDIYGLVTPIYPTNYQETIPVMLNQNDGALPLTWSRFGVFPSLIATEGSISAVFVGTYTNAPIVVVGGGSVVTPDTNSWTVVDNWTNLVMSGYMTNATVTVTDAPPEADALLTERIDPYGNSIHLNYTNSAGLYYLQSIVDYDGKVTTLSYDTNGYLASVLMPYSRTALFNYAANTNVELLSITDAQGMSSSFGYSSDGIMTAMTTPYGTTSFSQFDVLPNSVSKYNDTETRAIKITNPDSSTEMYAYFNKATNSAPVIYPADQVPSVDYLDSGVTYDPASAMNLRNSFYWGRNQCPDLSTLDVTALANLTPHDFLLGRMKHWKLMSDAQTLGTETSLIQEPSPDGVNPGMLTWFYYSNAGTPWLQGDDNTKPDAVYRLEPDGSLWSRQFSYDTLGQLTHDGTTVTDETGHDGSRDFDYNYLQVNYSEYCAANSFTNAWTADWLDSVYTPDNSESIVDPSPDTFSISTNRSGVSFVTSYPHWTSLEIGDGAGSDSYFYFNNHEQITGAISPTGLTTTNVYGTDNFLSKSTALEINATNSYTFANGLLASHTDPNGLLTQYAWDNLERLTGILYPDGSTIANLYTNLDLSDHKDRLGNWEHAHYDSMRQMTSFTDYRGNTTSLGYCLCGGVNSVTDPQNDTTTFNRNLVGWITSQIFSDAGGHYTTRSFTRDELGRVTHMTDSSGLDLYYLYDKQDLATNISSSYGTVFAATYNDANYPVTIMNGDGVSFTNIYDSVDRVVERDFGAGISQHYHYNGHEMDYSTDGLGNQLFYGYDPAGRVISTADNNSTPYHTNGFAYTSGGKLATLTDGNGHVTSWNYDIYGRRIAKTDGNGVLVETNGYDADSHLVAHWTPAKGLTQYGVDGNGNVTSVSYSSGTNVSSAYDTLNRIISMSDAVGTSTFSYQNFGAFMGALSTETAPWASDTVTHNYANRLPVSLTLSQLSGSWTESFTHDALLRLQTVSSPAGAFTYNYNGAGQEVLNLTMPGGNNIAKSYDNAGDLLTTALERGSSVLDYSGYAYDQDGNRTTAWRTGNEYVNYGYDDVGELTSAMGYETNGTLRGNENFGYGYDGAENLAFRTNNTLIQTFTSDNANELVNVTRNNNLLTVAGNLTNSLSALSVNGQAGSIYADKTFAVTGGVGLNDGLNTFTTVVTQGSISLTNTLTKNLPISATLSYDLNGNLVSDGQCGYVYDCANELTQVTATNQWRVQYVYDGFGRRRVRKAYEWVGGTWLESGEVRYIYDGMTVLQERNLLNSPVVTYTRGIDMSGSIEGAGGIGGLLARTDLSGNSYYHADGNGNVTMLVDSGGNQLAKYLYDPYGNMLGMWGSLAAGNAYRFSSKEIDANSGSYYFVYRYYQPNLQRWPNQDPIQENGGINLYEYVGNNPINWIDLFGLSGTLTIYSSGTSGLGNHSWLSYTPDGGTTTTYGTWGNNPQGLGNGLHEDLEQGRGADATRSMHLNDAQEAKFNKDISNNTGKGSKAWSYGHPCSGFASDTWNDSTGEHLNPYDWLGINNPTSLTGSIEAANGGSPNGTATSTTGNSSSYGGSIGNSSSGSLNSSINPIGGSLHGSGSF